MLYLKLSGRIATVTATVVTDNRVIQTLKKNLSEGFVDEGSVKGKRLFSETGLLTDEGFGYHLELVDIEDHQPGETVLKLIRLNDTNTFFAYPIPHHFNGGEEFLVYRIDEFTGELYAAMEGVDFQDFDVEDLYIGELLLDDELGYGGILSRVYYVPLEDAQGIAKVEDKKTARRHIVDMLKNGKADELRYYKLDLKAVDGEHKYFVVKNKDGELYNDWLT